MNEFVSLLRSFGIARIGAIIGVTCGVAIALSLIIARIGGASMGVLYTDIPYGEAQAVISRLEQTGVRHELRDRGDRVTILAPRDTISALRIELAADGVSTSNGVGYEIFDNASALGATSFQQNINRLRALEGELARTISSISGVRSARVHLVMPERELFAQDRDAASASIVVDAPGGLDGRSVRAIANLTASAVPGLSAAHVTVLDSAGALLASGANEADLDGLNGSIEDRKIAAEARIRRDVEQLLGRIVGAENVRVEVAADMDFSRVTESAEIVDPDSQTVLSSTTIEETSSEADPRSGRGVSVANGLPGAATTQVAGAAATSSSQRTEEITNYEITKTVRNSVKEEGLVVKRLSVAVALNSAAGDLSAPRTPEELTRIEALVRSAIGYNETRGDQLSLVDIPFTAAPDVAPAPAAIATPLMSRVDVMRLAEVGALALIAIALVVFVLRPMFAGSGTPTAPLAQHGAPAPVSASANAALPSPPDGGLEARIDLSQVEGQVKASSINKVADIVKAHTDESAGILRGWMRDAS